MSKGKREARSSGRSAEGNPFTAGTKKKRKQGGGNIALIALGCVAAAALLVVGVWKSLVVAPQVETAPPTVGSVQQGNTSSSEGAESEVPPAKRKEDYYTFLLIGKDTSSESTDTLILVSYDVPNGQVNMMSIPRDTVVNVPWSVKKINSVYSAKESNGGGLAGLKRQVAAITGVMPDFHVVIEWKAVGEIVDAVGGVEFDVPRNMNYDDPYQDLYIHLTKGRQTLSGEQAMAMLRYRTDNDKSIGYGDAGRAETQRNFLKAMAKKVLQLGNITKIGAFVEIFMENVETDLKLNHLMWFAAQAMSVDLSTMNSSTMPYVDVGSYRKGYYFMADPQGILPLVNEQFNPYDRDITAADLQVVQRAKDGSCYVTNGELLDKNWAQPYSGSMRAEAGGGSGTVLTGAAVSGGSPAGSQSGEPEEETDAPEENGEQTDASGESAENTESTENTEESEENTGETGEPGLETEHPGTSEEDTEHTGEGDGAAGDSGEPTRSENEEMQQEQGAESGTLPDEEPGSGHGQQVTEYPPVQPQPPQPPQGAG